MGLDSEAPKPSKGFKGIILFAVLLTLVGIGISLYSTVHHETVKVSGASDFACNINQTFSCDSVARSEYSEVFGIPLGVWGLGFYLGLLFVLGMGFVEKNEEKQKLLMQFYAVLTSLSIVISIVLGSISAFAIGALCLSCMGIYAVNVLHGVLIFTKLRSVMSPFNFSGAIQNASPAVVGLFIAVIGYNVLGSGVPKQVQEEATLTPAQSLSSKSVDISIAKSKYSGFGEDYRYGNENAKVVLVEFADFQCPACAQMASILKRIKTEYRDQILFVFKNYPLDQKCNPSINRKFHEYACDAAVLARCAGEFGKFWPFHDLVFENQQSLNTANAKKWAQQAGLSSDQIEACLASESRYEKIQQDVKDGNNAGVTGTPALFINGRAFIGNRDYLAIRAEIEKALAFN